MTRTRRQWLQGAVLWPACLPALAARKAFWESKDPANWTNDEKQMILSQSPWAREGSMVMEVGQPQRPAPPSGGTMPDMRPGVPPGGIRSVPLGGPAPPPPPNGDTGQQVRFRVLARWESAKPVRLAGGPETPDLGGEFYVIRLQGLPLMPPPKAKPGEDAPNPNERALEAIKENSRLERKSKPAIPCSRLFAGSGAEATQVLLFFPKGADPIAPADRLVTLETGFAQFHLSIPFPLKEMMYKGELAL